MQNGRPILQMPKKYSNISDKICLNSSRPLYKCGGVVLSFNDLFLFNFFLNYSKQFENNNSDSQKGKPHLYSLKVIWEHTLSSVHHRHSLNPIIYKSVKFKNQETKIIFIIPIGPSCPVLGILICVLVSVSNLLLVSAFLPIICLKKALGTSNFNWKPFSVSSIGVCKSHTSSQ